MLVSDDQSLIERARFLATQARDRAPHYQHSCLGFNYRMSNVLAAIGRGQLRVLPQRIAARRRNFEFYSRELGAVPGIEFMPRQEHGSGNHWLTCITIDPAEFGATREDVRLMFGGAQHRGAPGVEAAAHAAGLCRMSCSGRRTQRCDFRTWTCACQAVRICHKPTWSESAVSLLRRRKSAAAARL